jgi:hypothetical protein
VYSSGGVQQNLCLTIPDDWLAEPDEKLLPAMIPSSVDYSQYKTIHRRTGNSF